MEGYIGRRVLIAGVMAFGIGLSAIPARGAGAPNTEIPAADQKQIDQARAEAAARDAARRTPEAARRRAASRAAYVGIGDDEARSVAQVALGPTAFDSSGAELKVPEGHRVAEFDDENTAVIKDATDDEAPRLLAVSNTPCS